MGNIQRKYIRHRAFVFTSNLLLLLWQRVSNILKYFKPHVRYTFRLRVERQQRTINKPLQSSKCIGMICVRTSVAFSLCLWWNFDLHIVKFVRIFRVFFSTYRRIVITGCVAVTFWLKNVACVGVSCVCLSWIWGHYVSCFVYYISEIVWVHRAGASVDWHTVLFNKLFCFDHLS